MPIHLCLSPAVAPRGMGWPTEVSPLGPAAPCGPLPTAPHSGNCTILFLPLQEEKKKEEEEKQQLMYPYSLNKTSLWVEKKFNSLPHFFETRQRSLALTTYWGRTQGAEFGSERDRPGSSDLMFLVQGRQHVLTHLWGGGVSYLVTRSRCRWVLGDTFFILTASAGITVTSQPRVREQPW